MTLRLAVLTLVALAPAASAAPPWAGVYVGTDGKSTTAIVPVGDSIWWLDRSVEVVTVAKRGTGFTVSPIGGVLAAPQGAKGGWVLRAGGEVRTQVVDPFFERMRAGLGGEHTFLHLGNDARPDGGKLVIHDGLLAALDRGSRGCLPTLLRPDPSVNHEQKVARVAPQPTAGTIAARAFLLLELDPEEQSCSVTSLPSRPPRVRGLAGGAFVFARSDGAPIAVELVGYMVVELYLSRDATPSETREVMRAASEEAAHQAE